MDTSRFLEEAQTLAEYDHPNIVCLIGVVCKDPIYIVLELCGGGELLKFLREQGDVLQVSDLVRMSLEGAKGMEYLHFKGCIHRDLAARNCLISDDKVVIHILKLKDSSVSPNANVYPIPAPLNLDLENFRLWYVSYGCRRRRYLYCEYYCQANTH